MSHLWDLIDAYREHVDAVSRCGKPSEASVARGIKASPQAVNAWKKKGLRELPDHDTLKRLAVFINQPWRVVLDAALVDVGLLPADEAMPPRPYAASAPATFSAARRSAIA